MPSLNRPGTPSVYIKTYTSLSSVEQIWRQVLEKCSNANAFLTWEWADCWWNHCQNYAKSQDAVHSLHILIAYTEKDEPIGIFPFYYWQPKDKHYRRELRLLGDYGRREGMTEEPIFLTDPQYENAVLTGVLAELPKMQKYLKWDLATLCWQYLVSSDPHPRKSFFGSLNNYEGRQTLILPDSWNTYYRSTLSRSMRSNLKYYPRRLEKAGHTFKMRFLQTPEEIQVGLEYLVELHHHRATSTRGPQHMNHIPDSLSISFLYDCLTRLSMIGKVGIGLLEIDGKIVAAQSVFFYENELTFYYSGFDTAWYDFSPLTILTAEIINHAFKQEITRLNFLATPTPFRQRWGATTETQAYVAYIINPRIGSLYRLITDRVSYSRKGTESKPVHAVEAPAKRKGQKHNDLP